MKRRINYNLLTAEELAFYQTCNRQYGNLINYGLPTLTKALDEIKQRLESYPDDSFSVNLLKTLERYKEIKDRIGA